MERILLVEPEYKNKFPPMGLMKIATYHRNKGDIVEFYKGEAPYTQIKQANRIYVTTLFTFDYDVSVKCIQHYTKYFHRDAIFVGGIAATLLPSDFQRDTGIGNIIEGQLTSSSILGYDDNINIDILPLDYDILDDVLYRYPAGDNYFVHATRGCLRGCKFCAVRTLEPEFETTNHIVDQVNRVDEKYGPKRTLLMMDNNILYSRELGEIIQDIHSLGFDGEARFVQPNVLEQMLGKLQRRKAFGSDISRQILQTVDLLDLFASRLQRYPKTYADFSEAVEIVKQSADTYESLKTHSSFLTTVFDKYRPKPKLVRYVDFNQGIDARLINRKNMALLSRVPIRPFRLAYDSVAGTKTFTVSTKLAFRNNVRHFSNYMLYNWEDKPEELWQRLHTAVCLYEDLGDNVGGFSFPMRYAPVDERDRSHVGQHWNKKYLGAINVIVNVTKGVVAKEKDFFYEAFGSDVEEYFEILSMPEEFIRFRHFFEKNGLLDLWRGLFHSLTQEERAHLLNVLCEHKLDGAKPLFDHRVRIQRILVLYALNKSQFDRGGKTLESVQSEIESLGLSA